MAYPAFPTLGVGSFGPIAPGSSRTTKASVLTATFGDGYSQRTGNGINSIRCQFAYRSVPLTSDQLAALEAFLTDRRGYLPFSFQVPYEAAPRQFTCVTWQTDYSDPLYQTLTATFEENFDP